MTAKTIRLRQNTPEWEAWRRRHIGSADAPIIAGESPYRSRLSLYAEKTGHPEEPDEDTLHRFRLGHMLEPVILAMYAEDTGRKVRRGRILEDRAFPWLSASLDGEADGRVVEAKWSGDRRWDDGVPADVLVQVTHQMAVRGAEFADVAHLSPHSFTIHEVPFDPSFWAGIFALERDFWWDQIVRGVPPDPDASESSRRAIAALYPADDGATIEADAEMASLVTRILDGKDALSGLSDQLDGWENALRFLIGTASAVNGPGFRVTYRKSKDSQRIGWQEYAGSLERIVDQAGRASERDELRSIYTYSRPGPRVLRVMRAEG